MHGCCGGATQWKFAVTSYFFGVEGVIRIQVDGIVRRSMHLLLLCIQRGTLKMGDGGMLNLAMRCNNEMCMSMFLPMCGCTQP